MHRTVQYNTIQFKHMQSNTMHTSTQYNTRQHNATQNNTKQHIVIVMQPYNQEYRIQIHYSILLPCLLHLTCVMNSSIIIII